MNQWGYWTMPRSHTCLPSLRTHIVPKPWLRTPLVFFILDPRSPINLVYLVFLHPRSSILDSRFSILDPRSSILDPRSSILDSRFSILDSRFSILDLRSSILDPRSSILDSRFSILDSRFSILDPRSSILDSRFSILDSRFSILDPRSSILDSRSSILDPRSSILDPRFSILDPRSSILDPRFSILDSRFSILDSRFSIRDPRSSILDSRFSILHTLTVHLCQANPPIFLPQGMMKRILRLQFCGGVRVSPSCAGNRKVLAVVRSSKSLKSSCFMLETPKLCRFHALEMGPWYWLEMVGKGCELINALHDIAVPSWKKEKQSKIIWIQENGSLSFQNCQKPFADAVTAVAVPGPKTKITFPIFMNGTAAWILPGILSINDVLTRNPLA